MIGNSPDLPEYDKEREMEQREMDECYDWWDSLSDFEQYEIIATRYADYPITKETDIDKFFGDMTGDEQLWIYKRENKLTEEDIQGQRDMAGDLEYEERKLRGGDME